MERRGPAGSIPDADRSRSHEWEGDARGAQRVLRDAARPARASRWELLTERLRALIRALDGQTLTAAQAAPLVLGRELNETNGPWLLSETLCYLNHLERADKIVRSGEWWRQP